MSPPAVAAIWVGAGAVGAALLPRLRLRRLAPLVPLLAMACLLTVTLTPAVAVPTSDSGAGLQLDRTAQGVLLVSAVAMVLFLVRAEHIRGPELAIVGVSGAAALVMLSATQPLLWAEAPLVAIALLALRWIGMAPGRQSLAAGRAGITATAALLAAAPFLPLAAVQSDPRPALVGSLLAVGLAGLLGVLPLGGWTRAGMAVLPSAETAAWPLLLMPAALLALARVPAGLPTTSVSVFGHLLLALGLGSALWQGIQAVRGAGPRYARVLCGDVALAAAAVGSGSQGLATAAVLGLLLTHLIAAPLLLDEGKLPGRLRPLAWALLCGLPPSPSFWGRLLVLEAMAGIGFALPIALAAAGSLTVGAFLAMREHGPRHPAAPNGGQRLIDWALPPLLLAAGLAAGLAPDVVSRLLFGGQ